jgi:two-component system, LuxR family, sensor kinase FixL
MWAGRWSVNLRRPKCAQHQHFATTLHASHDEAGSSVHDSLAEQRGLNTIWDVLAHSQAELTAHVRPRQFVLIARAAILGQMSGVLAHEINQPLAAILGDAETALRLLDNDGDENAVRDILGDIIASVTRASEVIKRVRSMLRDGEMHRERMQLNDLVRGVLRLLHKDIHRRRITLECVLDPELAPIEADRVQIEQVILNLVVNACEAMNDTPESQRLLRVRTSAGPRAGEAQVSVADTGAGIPPDDRERIFHPFVTTKRDGLGLGLAICRSIVKAHGGTLRAEESERGALFRMVLRVPVSSPSELDLEATADESLKTML